MRGINKEFLKRNVAMRMRREVALGLRLARRYNLGLASSSFIGFCGCAAEP